VGVLSQDVGGVLWAPLLVALLLALLTAGSYAELVTKYPKAGGAAVFAERAFGQPVVSFLVGFCMLAAGVTSAAGLALAFAGDYLATFIDVPAVPVFLALVACLNARGISESVKSNMVMTIIELSGLLIVIIAVAVAAMLGGGRGDASRVASFPTARFRRWRSSAERSSGITRSSASKRRRTSPKRSRNASKVSPVALFGALITAAIVYTLVGIASATALSPSELSDSSGPLLAVVAASGVGIPDWVFSAIALVAVANGALLNMIMSSRLA
jgi:APA family basic amino acid/polyamine antiporter